ncbi:hypothetical protein L504_0075 [Bordetella bronchiseptica F2]|nr:hypothetical protein L504_0075 [Bordetella bronchiseptica F2]
MKDFISDVSRIFKGWPKFTIYHPYHVFNGCTIQGIYA